MRQFFSIVLAASLCAVGLFGLWSVLTSGAVWFGWMVMGSGFTLGVGGYWMWVDFLAPLLGRGRGS